MGKPTGRYQITRFKGERRDVPCDPHGEALSWVEVPPEQLNLCAVQEGFESAMEAMADYLGWRMADIRHLRVYGDPPVDRLVVRLNEPGVAGGWVYMVEPVADVAEVNRE